MTNATGGKNLSRTAVHAVLDDVHQVLMKHNVTQSVQVHFSAADDGPCFEFRRVLDDDGNPVLRKFPIPCPDE